MRENAIVRGAGPVAIDMPRSPGSKPPARSPGSKPATRRRDRTSDGLMRKLMTFLPLGIAVLDKDLRLVFWNERAGAVFGLPPMMAEATPRLAEVLAANPALTQPQCERVEAFCAGRITDPVQIEADGCMRLSLARERRITMQVQGLGGGRWMLVLDDGRVTVPGPASYSAWLDALTGLGNRRHFEAVLEEMLRVPAEDAHPAVLLLDLDGFERINEDHGRAAGDALLCLVAQRLRREVRDDDLLVRYGGDAFVILVPNGDAADALATRVTDLLAQPFSVEGRRLRISTTAVIARYPAHGRSCDTLMHHAEQALRMARTAVRPAIALIGDMRVQAPPRASQVHRQA